LKLSLCSFTLSDIDWAAIFDKNKEDQKKYSRDGRHHGISKMTNQVDFKFPSLWTLLSGFAILLSKKVLQFYYQKRNKKKPDNCVRISVFVL
jgi:hypothetical protein